MASSLPIQPPYGGTVHEGPEDRRRGARHHARRADRHPPHRPCGIVRLAEGHRGIRGRPPRAGPRGRLIAATSAAASSEAAAATVSRTPAGSPAGVSVSAADRRLAEIGVLIVMVLWAANFIVVKTALNVLPP